MPAPELSAFGDGSHVSGETGLTVEGGGFGAFPGSLWIYENADRTGDADELTVGDWNDIELSGVEIPGSLNNAAGTRYLFLEREDLAWSQGLAFTLALAGADRVVSCSPASVAVTAVSASVNRQRKVNASPAAIVVTATQAQVQAGANRVVSCTPASASIQGVPAVVNTSRRVNCLPAAIDVSAVLAELSKGRVVSASPASISISTVAAAIGRSRIVSCNPEQIEVTGIRASIAVQNAYANAERIRLTAQSERIRVA